MQSKIFKLLNVVFLVLLLHSSSFAQVKSGLAFLGDFDQAKKLASAEEKFIFVQVCTDWSQPCEEMSRTVFNDPEVSKFFEKRFVSVRINTERRGGIRFGRQYKIGSFPTLLYFDSEGELLHRIEGFANKDRLMQSADMSFRNPNQQAKIFKDDYRKLKNDPRYLRDYIMFCEETEDYELADKLSNQYAKQISKMDSLEWMDFVVQFVHSEDSKIFNLLKKNKPAFDRVYGKEVIDNLFLDIIINNEMWAMRKPATEKLLSKTRKKISKYKLDIGDDQVYPPLANRIFNTEIPFESDDARYVFAVKTLSDYSDKVNPTTLPAMIATVAVYTTDQNSLTVANREVDKLIASKPSMTLHDVKSILLYKLGEKEESYKQVALAQKYALEAGQTYKSSLAIMKKSGLVE